MYNLIVTDFTQFVEYMFLQEFVDKKENCFKETLQQGGETVKIILYLSVALIAISFFLLVVYIARTLVVLQETIRRLTATIDSLEKQMQGITSETTQLLKKTNMLANDVQQKIEGLNSIVRAVSDVSSTVQSFNQSLQQISTSVTKQVETHQEKVVKVMQWGNAFLEIWEKWKERKQKNIEEVSQDGKK
jgi:uncharacterized protein YoxC